MSEFSPSKHTEKAKKISQIGLGLIRSEKILPDRIMIRNEARQKIQTDRIMIKNSEKNSDRQN